ncbi:unnamed protein product, partial [Ostreobium quekettii]
VQLCHHLQRRIELPAVLWVLLGLLGDAWADFYRASRSDGQGLGSRNSIQGSRCSDGTFGWGWICSRWCLGGSGREMHTGEKAPQNGQAGNTIKERMQPTTQAISSASKRISSQHRQAFAFTKPLNALLVVLVWLKSAQSQVIPSKEFPAIVLIKNPWRQPTCSGVVVHKLYILTSAQCVETAGPEPWVLFPGLASNGIDQNGDGKVVQAQKAYVHPTWQANLEGGHDAALLRLPHSHAVDIPHPMIATIPFFAMHVYASVFVWVPIMNATMKEQLEIREFQVIDSNFCSGINGSRKHTFCIYSGMVDLKH